MNRKYLEDLGLEKEVIDKVMAEHGKAIQEASQAPEAVGERQAHVARPDGPERQRIDA